MTLPNLPDGTLEGDTHLYAVRVYYEDTDLAGIVYYANYLKFIERARTEWIRGIGVDQTRVKDEQGIVFAVRRVEADYMLPARYGDELEVRTTTASISGARLVMDQKVVRGEEILFTAQVTVACITMDGRPVRLPAGIRKIVN